MRIDEAATFFENFSVLSTMLKTFVEVGLGYVQLSLDSNSSGQVQFSTGGVTNKFVSPSAVAYLPVGYAATSFYLIDTLLTTSAYALAAGLADEISGPPPSGYR